ncbi:MAG: LamG domain-containing protein, partial [Candidatus Aenigmatarchaeota archaeon]
MRGITAVVSIILLLLITISLVGTAFVFIGRTVESSAQTGEEQVKQQTSQIGILFSIESVDKNHVYIRNAGVTPLQLSSLSFYVNNQKIDAAGPATLATGAMGEYFLDDAKLAMLPDPATLKISAGAFSQSQDVCFYCKYYAGYWKFDETSGATAGDSSENGNDGAYYGKLFNDGDISGGAVQTTGKYGYGMSFDGVNDNVTINGLKNRGFSNITVSAWVNAKIWSDNAIVSQWGQAGVGWASFGLSYGSGKLTFGTYAGSGGSTVVATDYSSTNTWVFVTGQFNGTHCLIYIDGEFKNSIPCVPPQISTEYPVVIGSVPVGGSYFNGTIDEVRIYNRAL